MQQYKVVFTVNGTRSETVVSASCRSDAEKLVKAQYGGQNVSILRVTI